MAALLFLKGDYIRAEPFFRVSLSIRVEQLGEDHHDVANSENNPADLLNRLGNYAEAEPLSIGHLTYFVCQRASGVEIFYKM